VTTRQRELNLLRYVPSSSLAHRMWAGTKITALLVLGIATFARPTWTTIGVVVAIAVAFAAASRLPRGVFGHPPVWIWWGLGMGALFATLASGKPNIHVLGATIGVGGLLDYLRFTSIGLVLVALGMILGWTTQLADIGQAVDRLAAPARVVGLPVDEIVLAIGLSVRCLPLLVSDVTVLRGAWRVRAPVRRMTTRERVQEIRDLLVAVLVSSLRRAREMADAIDARGGPRIAHRERIRFGAPDALAAGAVVVAVALIVEL
jgi:energy-coupling factor transporter transmembrane protein EcfT